jgi:hypothetical protein
MTTANPIRHSWSTAPTQEPTTRSTFSTQTAWSLPQTPPHLTGAPCNRLSSTGTYRLYRVRQEGLASRRVSPRAEYRSPGSHPFHQGTQGRLFHQGIQDHLFHQGFLKDESWARTSAAVLSLRRNLKGSLCPRAHSTQTASCTCHQGARTRLCPAACMWYSTGASWEREWHLVHWSCDQISNYTSFNLEKSHRLALQAPTPDLLLETTKSRKVWNSGIRLNYKIISSSSYFTASQNGTTSQTNKNMGACKSYACHWVRLVLLSNGNYDEIDPISFYKIVNPSIHL